MKRILICVCGILTLSGATCLDIFQPTKEQREAALRQFKSAEELRTYFAEQAIAVNQQGTNRSGFFFDMLPLSPSPNASEGATSGDQAGGGSGNGFSGTNLQEAGVDESDMVKAGNGYFYLLKGDSVRVVKAQPADDLQQVASVKMTGTPDSLYLYGHKLIVLSQSWKWWWGGWEDGPVPLGGNGSTSSSGTATVRAAAEDAVEPVPPMPDAPLIAPPAQDVMPIDEDDTSKTTVTIIDVTTPEAPVIEATLTFDGNLASSRMVANKLHLVITVTPELPVNPTPLAISTQTLEKWIPDYTIADSDGTTTGGDIVDWQDCYYPLNADGYGTTMVITVDVNNPSDKFESVAIVADAGTIYASTEAMYVTDTSYDMNGYWREDTAVHKFNLGTQGAEYVGSALVPGHLLNQYSLGEKDGYLRMASTINTYGPTTSSVSNAVYVLDKTATEGKLNIVGRIEDIAPGERLYSARFVGDRGFLVTFKQVDPLFTLDLSKPDDPKRIGELKVPGYSEYIHILDENHLLTIGRDVWEMENTALNMGVQLSVFDVTDFANPTLLHKEVIGSRGTYSEAAGNPKAFNYYAPKNVLAFPITIYDSPVPQSPFAYGEQTFQGVLFYQVTVADGFTELGHISTQLTSNQDGSEWWSYSQYARGIIATDSDEVYAVTDQLVKSAPLATPTNVTDTLVLPE